MSTSLALADHIAAFRAAMSEHGVATDRIEADGKLHRFRAQDDAKGRRNAWYVFHADGFPAGAFGSWRTGLRVTWSAPQNNGLGPTENADVVRTIDEDRRRRKAEDDANAARAAVRAADLWSRAIPARADHPYLVSRGVRPYGIRQLGDNLVIPMRSADGQLAGIQRIWPDGQKRFGRGTRKRGTYFPIGTLADVLVIAEGFATSASIHEATGYPVAVAFDCGNLEPVARALRTKYSNTRIIIAADNDRWTTGNPGLKAARSAAAVVNGSVAAPTFAGVDDGTDWNDVARRDGLAAVRAAFTSKNREAQRPLTTRDIRVNTALRLLGAAS